MPPIDALLAFAALSFALIIVPGPSVLFVVSRGVSLGRRAALLTVAGNAAGVLGQVVLVAVGLGVVVERSAAAFTVLKLAGAGYLIWLGVHTVLDRRDLSGVLEVGGRRRSQRSLFTDGMVVGLTNPKLIVFLGAILPQFVRPGGAPAGLQMVVLGFVFVSIALVVDSLWGLAAGSARHWFARSPRRLERLGGAGGLVMIGLGVRLAAAGRAD